MKIIIKMRFCIWILVIFSLSCCFAEETSVPEKSSSELLVLGDVAFKSGRTDEAIKYFTQVIQLPKPPIDAYYKRAAAYLVKGNKLTALEDLNKVLSIKSDFYQALTRRGKLLVELGDFEKATADAKSIKVRDAALTNQMLSTIEKSKQLLKDASTAFDKKDWNGAKLLYSKLLEDATDYVAARLAHADCGLETKDYQTTIDDTSRVLKSSKDNLNALLKRGQAFFFMGDSENAIKNLQQGLKYDPDNKLMREQFKRIRAIEKAIKEGNDALGSNRFTEALDFVIAVLGKEPKATQYEISLLVIKCKAHLRLKENEKAISSCVQVIEKDEGHQEAYILRGEAQIQAQLFEEAVKSMQKAVELNNGNRDAQEGLRKAQRQLKMSKRLDYYKLLSVAKDANEKEIKKSYRTLALEWHPDKHEEEKKMEAEQKFREISEAYQILSDPEKRRKYDLGEDLDEQQQNPFQHDPFQQFTFHFGGGGFRRG